MGQWHFDSYSIILFLSTAITTMLCLVILIPWLVLPLDCKVDSFNRPLKGKITQKEDLQLVKDFFRNAVIKSIHFSMWKCASDDCCLAFMFQSMSLKTCIYETIRRNNTNHTVLYPLSTLIVHYKKCKEITSKSKEETTARVKDTWPTVPVLIVDNKTRTSVKYSQTTMTTGTATAGATTFSTTTSTTTTTTTTTTSTTTVSYQNCRCRNQGQPTMYLSVWTNQHKTALFHYIPAKNRFVFTGRMFKDKLYLITVDTTECRLYGQGRSGKNYYLISACIDGGHSKKFVHEVANKDVLFLAVDSKRKLIVISVMKYGRARPATIKAVHPNGTFTSLNTHLKESTRWNHYALSVSDHRVYYILTDTYLGFVDYLHGTKINKMRPIIYGYGIACGMEPGTVYFLFRKPGVTFKIGSYRFINNKLIEMPQFGQEVDYLKKGYPEYARVLSWNKVDRIFVLLNKRLKPKRSFVATTIPGSERTDYTYIPEGTQYSISFI